MKVAVIGAGIVGVTTAYELALAGTEVAVFERQGVVASECSFANAGVVAPGYVSPWASPGMAWKVLRHLPSRHTPVRFGGLDSLRHLPWMWRWWRACRPAVYQPNRRAMQRLALFSRERLHELTAKLRLDYEQAGGYLVLLRGAADLRRALAAVPMLQELGIRHEVVDAARCRQIEPGLSGATVLAGGIHLPDDGVGNCRHFAQLLKAEAQRLGASFRFGTTVQALRSGDRPAVRLAGGDDEPFDALVVCAGVQSAALLSPLGLQLPLAPVYGYSLTAPLRSHDGRDEHAGPRAALMDERFKVAISRLGDRVRVAGSAVLGGPPGRLDDAPLRTLHQVLDDWFPGAAVARKAQHWKGARPMLPDGPPVLGASGLPGVWLNLGHGGSGWALACGSARVLADALLGRDAPLDLDRLTLARLR
ncbi:MAG: D-amino acid dehydrogenase [Rubrivivax sp.]|nr:D-amino acid dehydrogenase [Rubrivivax sp.]